MTEFALFDVEQFTVPTLPRPRELKQIEVDGITYLLVEFAEGHLNAVMGWYYGYPPCCVEHFVADRPRRLKAGRVEAAIRHPVSGHLLCPECAKGPLAPLPDRPARRYGWARWVEDEDQPLFYPPSDYTWRGAAA